ncbi:hypothetical protein [Pseudomonas sp. 10S4]|uniref:hypothetical protein n=1 Tax=Pseudomonas sp. 10S4 TaxID=3048583 RepID=UPI002AC9F179|nr:MULTISPECIES: hypothetical protein [unclassified Pseudomonas]MEB0222886.1 hypothetical protein [Pseudomonas sp. 5S1]MEB0293069.1 hypothetical protein [Pseudomonas sp. 10S4]WPX17189.1 hypothetical protein RHM58_25205 [Pseudomonas sp. 10S4]
MNGEVFAASNVVFMVERPMRWHGFADHEPYMASVEVVDNHVSLVLDDSEYCFTGQQCAEVTKSLARVLLTYSHLGVLQGAAESISQLKAYASWCQLIQTRTLPTERDSLQTFESEKKGFEFCASGSFRHPESLHGEPTYYKLAIALDDDLDLPCLSIDGRSFSLSFEEAFWLMEQLWAAGSLLAQTVQSSKSTVKVPWINDQGKLTQI